MDTEKTVFLAGRIAGEINSFYLQHETLYSRAW